MKRKSLKDTLRENAQAMNFYARMADKPAVLIPEGSVRRGPRTRQPDDEPLEGAEQAAVVKWWYFYSKSRSIDYRLLVAIPNAQKLMAFATNRHAFMQTLRNEGFRDGAPDLLLLVPNENYNGMAIEMKRKTKGKVSPEQESYKKLLLTSGYYAMIARGADDAILMIQRYLNGPVK